MGQWKRKRRRQSSFLYRLQFAEGDMRWTRLLHLKYRLCQPSKKTNHKNTEEKMAPKRWSEKEVSTLISKITHLGGSLTNAQQRELASKMGRTYKSVHERYRRLINYKESEHI